jgi:hypothetical protein
MSALPKSPIVCQYAGIDFPTETETLGMEWKPVYDASGRAVSYVELTITLRAIFATANQALDLPTDSTVTSLRQQLTQPGGRLYIQFIGSGDIIINFGRVLSRLPALQETFIIP